MKILYDYKPTKYFKNIHKRIQGSKRQKRRVRGKLKEKYPYGVDF